MNIHQNASPVSATTQSDARAPDARFDPVEILHTLWRRKRFILGVGAVCMCLGGVYGFRIAEPHYAATTTLILQPGQQQMPDLNAVMANVSTEISSMNTELHVIRSRGLVEQLVDRLQLTQDPEFNPELRTRSLLSAASLKDVLRSVLAGQQSTASPAPNVMRDQVVRNVQSSISAQLQRNSYLFTISITSLDKQKAALMANTLAELYLEDQVRAKFAAVEDAVLWLSQRVSTLETELRKREDAVAEMRGRATAASPQALKLANTQLKDTRRRLANMQDAAVSGRARLDKLMAAKDAGNLPVMADLSQDKTLSRLLASSDSSKAFQERFKQVETRLQTNQDRLTLQYDALLRAEKEQAAMVEQQAADLAQLQQLDREAQATRVLYETFLTRLKETSVQRGLQQADSRILSEAVQGVYVAPRKSLILILSLMAGMLGAGGAVLGRQFLHSGYRNAADLERDTGVPVLGQVPIIPIKDRSQLLGFLSGQPTSAATEAIRNLRTSILMSNLDNPPQIILSTSSVPGEGKTTQSIALVHNLSGLNKRVLLIEGDIRRRTFARYFDADHTYGIVSVLSGTTTLPEAVFHDPSLKADVLAGELSHANAADVFASAKFEELLQQARIAYDYIVIDTPPVLVVPDARVIARHADAVLYSVAWDNTKRSQIAEGMRQFDMVNIPITGMVLAQIEPEGMARYGYAGNYGAYSTFGDGYYGAR